MYNLQRNKSSYFEHHIIKFSVKPTQREKTPLGNKPTYDGWVIIHKGGVVLAIGLFALKFFDHSLTI